ncbi:hypothetical protein RRG08_041503 [Elysia crispata]|uniref:Uncharacterized protein n=1 Tax=Elysia crispata TaxID=231223 RepID=A0AAE0Y2I2_9GAST|nr:hypothetical protein RRG08_041503 [Elysia crispata]
MLGCDQDTRQPSLDRDTRMLEVKQETAPEIDTWTAGKQVVDCPCRVSHYFQNCRFRFPCEGKEDRSYLNSYEAITAQAWIIREANAAHWIMFYIVMPLGEARDAPTCISGSYMDATLGPPSQEGKGEEEKWGELGAGKKVRWSWKEGEGDDKEASSS